MFLFPTFQTAIPILLRTGRIPTIHRESDHSSSSPASSTSDTPIETFAPRLTLRADCSRAYSTSLPAATDFAHRAGFVLAPISATLSSPRPVYSGKHTTSFAKISTQATQRESPWAATLSDGKSSNASRKPLHIRNVAAPGLASADLHLPSPVPYRVRDDRIASPTVHCIFFLPCSPHCTEQCPSPETTPHMHKQQPNTQHTLSTARRGFAKVYTPPAAEETTESLFTCA